MKWKMDGWRFLAGFAGAMWGLAAAATLRHLWVRPAPADQVPGLMKMANLDARGPMAELVSTVLLILGGAVLMTLVIRMLPSAKRWQHICAVSACTLTLWAALRDAATVTAILFPLATLGTLIALRSFEPRFTRRDVILIPSTIATWFALLQISAGAATMLLIAAAATTTLRILLARLTTHPELAFVTAAAAISLQSQFVALPSAARAAATLFCTLAAPAIVAAFVGGRRLQPRLLSCAFATTYVVLALAYPLTHSAAGAQLPYRVDFFEDGHGLLPASEMLRGERPYADIIPAHGLLSDGYLDYLSMRIGEPDLRSAYRGRLILSSLTPVAIHALGTAITGMPEIGFLTLLWTSSMAGDPLWARVAFSLFAVAAAVAAVRRRKRRLLIVAGALVVVAVLVSIEFGAYAALVVAAAALRWSHTAGSRVRAVAMVSAGAAGLALPLLVALAIAGVARAFFEVTLTEVLTLGPAYALGLFRPDAALSSWGGFPDALGALVRPGSTPAIAWFACVLLTAALAAQAPLTARRRFEPIVLTGFWIVLAAVSYAERHHHYAMFGFGAFFLGGVVLFWRASGRRLRHAGVIAASLLIIAARPDEYLSRMVTVRTERSLRAHDRTSWPGSPRAKGASFTFAEREGLDAAKKFVDTFLNSDETFFDFSNSGLLYFLLNRDCPIRQYEVPFYQSEAAQREVIHRLETNRRVRAVLMQFPHHLVWIDGVPQSTRAPLVWQYIRENFAPAFDEAGVLFWIRTPAARAIRSYRGYLLPVAIEPIRGVSDLQWSTELLVVNRSSTPLRYLPRCENHVCGDSPGIVAPQTEGRPDTDYAEPAEPPGLLLYLQPSSAPAEVVLKTVARRNGSKVAEHPLPVIPVERLGARTVVLRDVPFRSSHRGVLRIYDAELTAAGLSCRIRLVGSRPARQVVASAERRLSVSASVYEPAYVQIPLSELGPDLSEGTVVDIEVDPASPSSRSWAYVSLVDNETDEIHLVTPAD